MSIVYLATSNTSEPSIPDNSSKYLVAQSTTIKNLAVNGAGVEVFDLGKSWQDIDHLVVSLVYGKDSTSSIVNCAFSNDPTKLTIAGTDITTNTGILAGVNFNGNSRVSSSAGLTGAVFTVKVTERYFRVKVANGTTQAQANNFYVDIKGFSAV